MVSTISLPQISGSNLLTNSRMSTYKTCPRKHYYRYEIGVRRDTDAKPLRMGSAVHLGLDLKCKGEEETAALLAATDSYDQFPLWANDEETQHEWLVERETVRRLLAGYWWRWGDDADIVSEVIASEISFDLPIRNPETGGTSTVFRVGGKIDKIVRLRDGRIAVMEHKTCGEDLGPDSDYWKRLRIDQQISLYMCAAREMGHDVQTVLYDVIRKPSIAPKQIPVTDEQGLKVVVDQNGERVLKQNIKKNGEPGVGHGEPMQSGNTEKGWTLLTRTETPEEFGERLSNDMVERPDFYFARQEIPRLDSDLEEFRFELWQQQQAIRASQQHGRHFRNTSACLVMGRCEYLDQCHNGIDVANIPSGFVRVADLHPELGGEE